METPSAIGRGVFIFQPRSREGIAGGIIGLEDQGAA